MVDLVSAGVALAGGYFSKDLLVKIFGPTSDYLGAGLRDLVQRQAETVGKILHNAASKAASETEGSAVPPILVKDLLQNASFKEDVFSIEYFGGILASSKTGISRDDRAAKMSATLNRLSAYDLRLHYLIYHYVAETHQGRNLDLYREEHRRDGLVVIPYASYLTTMAYSEVELPQEQTIFGGSIFTLLREDLIGEQTASGSKELLAQKGIKHHEGGLAVYPTVLGAELFLRAHGLANSEVRNLTAPGCKFPPLSGIDIQVAKPVTK